MQKIIGVTELQRKFRSILDEVALDNTPYVLTRGSRPQAAIISYAEFARFLAWKEGEILAEFDRARLRLAEQKAGFSDDEVAADVAAAIAETAPGDSLGQTPLDAVRTLSTNDKRRLWEILSDEFGESSGKGSSEPLLREAQPEYLALGQGRALNALPASGGFVWISFQTPTRLADDLQAVAQTRRTSIESILNELLSTSLALLQMDHLPDEDPDSLAVRRELAAASIAALGDFWDNEVDQEWQDFQP